MASNPSLSARLGRAGIVALPTTRRLTDGGLELRYRLSERTGAGVDPAVRLPAAALDRSLIGSGPDWWDRWEAECARADVVCAVHFGINERHIFLRNGLVVVHFFDAARTVSARWVEGLGWAGPAGA